MSNCLNFLHYIFNSENRLPLHTTPKQIALFKKKKSPQLVSLES